MKHVADSGKQLCFNGHLQICPGLAGALVSSEIVGVVVLQTCSQPKPSNIYNTSLETEK